MNKPLKIFLYVLAFLAILIFVVFPIIKSQVKKSSPASKALYEKNVNGKRFKITVDYSRPSKKGRKIFGGLVPFDSVWRTGANEATVFNTNCELKIGEQILAPGHYTFWTIPGPQSWTVIFNKKDYSWGIDMNGKASRDPNFDVLKIQVPVQHIDQVLEQFTIDLTGDPLSSLDLRWDQTKVSVPVKIQ